MPLVSESTYRSSRWVRGGHLETIVPALFRRVPRVTDELERIELADGDFLDLEWRREGRDRLVILSHGLEGSAGAAYIQGMAGALMRRGWDVLAWNCRGCSGEINRLPRFYHSGETGDLGTVVEHALRNHPAEVIDLVGFSLGGNMTLKYLGERAGGVSARLGRGVAFSVPCDLACSSRSLATPLNQALYMKRFIASLAEKIRAKHARFPGRFDIGGLEVVRTFREFDDRYTAPLHGFRNAEDYWERSSCRRFLPAIAVPSLLVNAANDPFLGPGCFPREEACASTDFHLEVPRTGGHLGFAGFPREESWAERRAALFLSGE